LNDGWLSLFSGEVGGSLWKVNLHFSVGEGDIDLSTRDLLAVRIWVENVTDGGSFGPGGSWRELNLVVAVGQSNEEISSVEGIDVVENVLLLKWVSPDLLRLSGLVDLGGHLVNVGVGVHILPE